MKINYDLKLKEELEKIKGTKPTLLLHVCCGPCSGNVLKEISEFFDITIYYSNSNIYPDTEYFRRFHELENFIQCFNQDFNQNIQVVEKEYQPKEYLKDISQYKNEPEGGKRCLVCHDLRIKLAYEYAYNNNFPYYTTVMTVSSHKPSSYLNNLGLRLQNDYPTTKFLVADFKKENGQLLGIQIAKKYNLYRQNYCGCIFAKKMQEELKAIKEKKLIIN